MLSSGIPTAPPPPIYEEFLFHSETQIFREYMMLPEFWGKSQVIIHFPNLFGIRSISVSVTKKILKLFNNFLINIHI